MDLITNDGVGARPRAGRTAVPRGARLLASGLACLAAVTLSAAPAVAKERLEPRNLAEASWWFDAMHLAEAHKKSTGEGATIALIDSAIDTSVPELQGADLRLRYDCHKRRARPGSGPGSSHGTAQAALLVGNGRGNAENGAGVRGIAPGATVLAYTNDLRPEQEHIQCDTKALVHMIDDAVRQGADVISIAASLESGLNDAVQRALDAGVVVVAAAGADDVSSHSWPADKVGVVSVKAVDENAKPWKHNRTNGAPVISAPGVYVGSGGIFEDGWSSNAWMTGSSPATTITSGSLALVKARYPEATGNQLVQHLIHYTGGETAFTYDEDYGFGIVSVTRMLESTPTQWPDESPLQKYVDKAVEQYPMSASTLVDGKDESAQEATSTERSASSATTSDDEAAGSSDEAAGSAGLPAWTWPLAGAVVVAAAGGVLLARRGRRTTSGAGIETRGA